MVGVRSKLFLITFAILMVGTILVAASAVHLLRPQQQAAPAPSSTAAVPATVAVAARPACPQLQLPELQLPCLGNDNPSYPSSNKTQVIALWAWWCEPCRTELPLLAEVAANHPEWDVVGIHADQKAAAGADFLGELALGLPSYQDSHGATAAALGLPGVIPLLVVVKDGQVNWHAQTVTSAAQIEALVRG